MRVCDICHDHEHQPVARASLHVKSKSMGALDICDACLARAAESMSPNRSAAARKRLRPWVPRELTDSEPDAEGDADLSAREYAALATTSRLPVNEHVRGISATSRGGVSIDPIATSREGEV